MKYLIFILVVILNYFFLPKIFNSKLDFYNAELNSFRAVISQNRNIIHSNLNELFIKKFNGKVKFGFDYEQSIRNAKTSAFKNELYIQPKKNYKINKTILNESIEEIKSIFKKNENSIYLELHVMFRDSNSNRYSYLDSVLYHDK